MELNLKNGKVIEVFDFQPKSTNLIKVDLHIEGDAHEGIWAVIPDEFQKMYKNDNEEESYAFASLRNDAVAFYPHPSWGLIIPIRFRGEQRPECDLTWIVEDTEMIYNRKDTEEVPEDNQKDEVQSLMDKKED